MDIQIDNSYDNVASLIRYASILFFNKTYQNNYAEKLVETANQLKYFAYPITLINNISDTSISSALKPHLKPNNSERVILEMNQQDSHFIDSIGVSEIDKNVENILKAYNNFYNSGNFNKFNRASYRFLKRIKGANEYEMNDIINRYMISCICMNDYDNCINIIESVGQNYVLFDYNIYLFMLYFTQGKYDEACDKILQIKNNVCEDFYKIVNEKDLAFYFSFCLLYNFNSLNYKLILSNNDTLVYKLYVKYREYFEIIDDYYRCDYLKVNSVFNKTIKEKINKDPFLSGFSKEIEYNFKRKILKEILSFASEINFETIQNLLLLKNKREAEEMIFDLIKKDKISAVIDDIEGIIIVKEKNPINEILEKSNNIMKNNLSDLINNSLRKNVKHKFESKNFVGELIERRNLKEIELDIGLAMQYGIIP